MAGSAMPLAFIRIWSDTREVRTLATPDLALGCWIAHIILLVRKAPVDED